MTVAVAVKVFDGIVLATDSATTMDLAGGGHQVWNNANKLFHLHRRHPIAAMTWGLGNVGSSNIATIAKDFRRRIMGRDPDHLDWELGDDYTVEAVANQLLDMVYDELYQPQFAGQPITPTLGFLISGYSAGEQLAEAWLILIESAALRPVPVTAVAQDQSGWLAYAQPEATVRLLNGFDPALLSALPALLPPAEAAKVTAFLTGGSLQRQPVVAGMPFADAIGFARYLVDVTVGYSRYLLGPDTVGGPVELAGITRHEGFKWISRKHYYPASLNPEDPHHDY